MRLIDSSTGQTIENIGESHSATSLDAGSCSCGWTASGPHISTKTWDHLYGDLDWISLRKLERVVGPRP